MCNKMAFDSRKAALTEAKRLKSAYSRRTKNNTKKLHTYRCRYCGYHHLTTTKKITKYKILNNVGV